MQSIKIDNDIRSSLSSSPFGKYTSQLGKQAIYVCSHSLSGESVRVFITLAIDCIEIKVWNQRLFREATLAISFATVNALILKFISQYDSSHRIGIESMPSKHVHDDSNYTNANLLIEFWDAIARSVSLTDFGHLTLNTQHIVYFIPVNSARGDLSYLLYSTSRYMEKEQQTWSIEFVSESVYPFMLEVKVQKNPFDTKIYVTRIDQKYLRFLFLYCTLHTKIDLGNAETNKQIKPMFEYIVDELIYDTDSDTIIVRYIKKLELQLFNSNTISKNPIDSKFKMNEIEKSVRQTVIQTLKGNKTATLAFIGHNFSKDEAIEEEDETIVEEDIPQQPKKGIGFLKSKVKLVQIVGETRRALQTKDSETLSDKGPLYFIVREALNIKGELRSKMSQNCIIQFLTQGTRMKDLLAQCSEYDLMRLSDACMLREINHSYELLGNTGDTISTIYIILHGQVDMIFKTHVQTRSDGHVVGNIMDGEHLWNADVVVRKSYSASLCCIPTNMILECVGIGGPAPREYMKCFWKSIRMWEEVMKPKIRPVFDPSLFVSASPEDDKNATSVTDGIEKMLTISYPNTMNVTDSIRIRIVNAGNEIFRLGQTRHFLYLIVHGECAVLKKINTIDSNGSNCISEIETGVRLLPGDFIFMDGENVDWIERKRKRLELELENPILRKNANKNTFDTHMHTMVAMTRVEICVVPITEIAKSVVLFTSLLLLSVSKYSSLLSTQKDYERRLEDNKKWSLNRASVLEDVNTGRKQKALNSNPYTDLNTDTNAMSILEKILSELPSNNSNSNSTSIPKPPSNGIRSKSRSIKTTNYMNPNKNNSSK